MTPLISLTLTLTIVLIIVPNLSLIQTERMILKDRRIISSTLHDELQQIIEQPKILNSFQMKKKINNQKVVFNFTNEGTDKRFIKGCALWENLKMRQEEVCLYAVSLEQ